MNKKRAKFEGAFILDAVLNYDPRPNVQDIPNDIRGVSTNFKWKCLEKS